MTPSGKTGFNCRLTGAGKRFTPLSLSLLLLALPYRPAEGVRIAVASNFSGPMNSLRIAFEPRYGPLTLVVGSTGTHYAQIKAGAPFDIFLAADEKRPRKLEKEGLTVPGSRFTYAIGKLILWSRDPTTVGEGDGVLRDPSLDHLAVANPRFAPYGRAAMEVLAALGIKESWENRLVHGETVGQTFQFVHHGASEIGFVALSQVVRLGQKPLGSFWMVPEHLYAPIVQQAVLLKDTPEGNTFMTFLRSEKSRQIITKWGYGLAEGGGP